MTYPDDNRIVLDFLVKDATGRLHAECPTFASAQAACRAILAETDVPALLIWHEELTAFPVASAGPAEYGDDIAFKTGDGSRNVRDLPIRVWVEE